MDLSTRESTAHVLDRTQADRQELVAWLKRAVPSDGSTVPLHGLRLYRHSTSGDPVHGVSDPSVCVIAQGSKELILGERRYRYDPGHYLIVTAELPIVSWVTEATPDDPYLSVVLTLDHTLVSSVMVEAGFPPPGDNSSHSAIDVNPLDGDLLDAVVRLVRLLDAPDDVRFLISLVKREIVYRLLMGAQNERVRQLTALGGDTHRISQAIQRLRKDFDQPLRIEDLAAELGMSVSGFHHHFKAVTATSPLRFQKQLRLQEARRLMLDECFDAASAGHQVGYGDAAHFNREYKRMFGEPPMRDVERLRENGRV